MQIGFLSNCNRRHTQNVQAKPPKEGREFSTRTSDQPIHNTYHTSLHSDTVCPVRIQMWRYIRLNKKLPESKLGRALNTARQTCLVHQQTETAHHAQQSTLTDPLHDVCSTSKEKQQRKTRGRHPSAKRERQPQQTLVIRKLDYTSRLVRVIPTLSPNQTSHNSIGHGGR